MLLFAFKISNVAHLSYVLTYDFFLFTKVPTSRKIWRPDPVQAQELGLVPAPELDRDHLVVREETKAPKVPAAKEKYKKMAQCIKAPSHQCTRDQRSQPPNR